MQKIKNTKRSLAITLLILICITLSCFPLYALASDTKRSSRNYQKIIIAQYGHVFVYLPIYIAKNKGFFKDEGLEVKYVSTGGDEKTYAAVVSNSAQFGVADPTFVAIARQSGNNSGVIIGNIINSVPFWGVSKGKYDTTKLLSLKGKRIATYPAPSTNYALIDWLNKKYDLNIKIVQGSFGALLSILKNDRADMAMMLEPTASVAVTNGYNVVFTYKDIFSKFAFTGLSTTKDYANNNPETCRKVLRALQRAFDYAHNNFEGTVEVAMQEFKEFDKDVIRLGVTRMIKDSTIPKSIKVSNEAWDQAIEIRRFIGDLKKSATFCDNVDNSFAPN
jgi:NitT/TauT family transport system substrate-binding protein